jgi:hypothetical protein
MRCFMLCVLHVLCCVLHVACCTCVLQIIRRLQQSLMIRFGVMKILKYSIMVPPSFPPSAPTHPVLHPAVASARGPQEITACYSGARDVVCCPARATLHAMQPGDHGDPLVGVLLVSRLGPLRVSRLVGPSRLAHSTPVLCELQERFVSDSAAAPHALCIPMDALHCAAPVRAGTACR